MYNYSFIDLHIHTEFSEEPGCDDTIETVFKDAEKIAERSGRKCLLAIADHNTILGVRQARKLLETGKYKHIELVSGAEFTTFIGELNSLFGNKSVFNRAHILAYGFDENDPALIKFSEDFHSGRVSYLSFRELSNLIKNAGGHLIMAHPGLTKVNPRGFYFYTGEKNHNEVVDCSKHGGDTKTILRQVPGGKYVLEAIFEKLQEISEGTLVGMERFHPDNYFKGFDYGIEKICNEKGLVQTAGSDFHGYHLHTAFSVGNPFSQTFQEFYKDKLNDCKEFRNGLHVSHLPNIEFLTGESKTLNPVVPERDTTFINGKGIPVSYEQYQIVQSALNDELLRKFQENNKNNENFRKNDRNNRKNRSENQKHNKKGRKNKIRKEKYNKYYEQKEKDFDLNMSNDENQFDK